MSMNQQLATRLILAKMGSKNAASRPLCREIMQAAELLCTISSEECADELRYECMEALAREAAKSTPLRLLVQRFMPSTMVDFNTLNGAFVAGISMDRKIVVETILNINVDVSDTLFGHPFQVAGRIGSEDMVRLLLDHFRAKYGKPCGCPVANTTYIEHLLCGAASKGRENIVLIALSPEYSSLRSLNHTRYKEAVYKSIQKGHEGVTRLLVKHRPPAGILWNERVFWEDLLFASVTYGRDRFVRMALQSPDLHDSSLQMAFSKACGHGHLELAKLIRPRAKPEDGFALIEAARHGHRDVVDFLFQNGARIICVHHTRRPLSCAHPVIVAAGNGHVEVVQDLLMRGVDLRVCDCGARALACAAERKHRDVVRVLLEAGADYRLAPKRGMSPKAVWLMRDVLNEGLAASIRLYLMNNAMEGLGIGIET